MSDTCERITDEEIHKFIRLCKSVEDDSTKCRRIIGQQRHDLGVAKTLLSQYYDYYCKTSGQVHLGLEVFLGKKVNRYNELLEKEARLDALEAGLENMKGVVL